MVHHPILSRCPCFISSTLGCLTVPGALRPDWDFGRRYNLYQGVKADQGFPRLPHRPVGHASLALCAAVLFLGETITWSLALGTALVLVGIYLIIGLGAGNRLPLAVPTTGKKEMGIGLILIAFLLWAISISLLKLGLQEVRLILANGVRMLVASLALMILILFQKSVPQPTGLHIHDMAVGAVSGILAFGLGGLLFLQVILYAGAAKATVLTSSAPLFGLPLSLVFLKERVTVRIATGTVLVVLGIVFIV